MMDCKAKSKKLKESLKKTANKVGNFVYENRDYIIPDWCKVYCKESKHK